LNAILNYLISNYINKDYDEIIIEINNLSKNSLNWIIFIVIKNIYQKIIITLLFI